MNRWIRKVVMFGSLAGAVALATGGGIALANEQGEAQHAKGEHGHKHHGGLVSAALKLDSLTGTQKTQIEKLVEERKAAHVPVRQTDARVLTELAHQVDQAKIDRESLKGSLEAESLAAQAARNVEVSSLAQLHTILTPAQRGQLVDAVQARMPQGKALPPALASFRGDSFDAAGTVRLEIPGEHAISRAESKVPSMTPQERATFASHLRERASRESK
jgi:Spy/CpxP family protein refolding chaperone